MPSNPVPSSVNVPDSETWPAPQLGSGVVVPPEAPVLGTKPVHPLLALGYRLTSAANLALSFSTPVIDAPPLSIPA